MDKPNTNQLRKGLEAEYDIMLARWQKQMRETEDEETQHKLHIVGNRMYALYEQMSDEILSGKR